MRSRSLAAPALLIIALAGSAPGVATTPPQARAQAAVPAPSAAVAAAAAPAAASSAAFSAGGGRRAGSHLLVARYSFNGGHPYLIADESGHGHTLRVVAGNGGVVSRVRHGSGRALRFPGKCAAKKKCPHAALQSPSAANLNPGTRPLSYGAKLLLSRTQTSKGQNIVQKGYSTVSSQYKLQVDGRAGRASCVLVGAKPGVITIITSTISVADGHWHAVECRRSPTALAVLVDGAVRGNRAVPADLSVNNNRPLSVGGKGATSDNDQFQGILDDVWVRIG